MYRLVYQSLDFKSALQPQVPGSVSLGFVVVKKLGMDIEQLIYLKVSFFGCIVYAYTVFVFFSFLFKNRWLDLIYLLCQYIADRVRH